VIEAQRRIHELELQREREAQQEPAPPPPAPVEEPRREEPRREETRIEPKKLLEEAGLVMIETDRAKAPVASPPEEEPLHLGRPRRERPKPQPQDDELQQVETKR
jgi:hypothetical protein